MTSLPGIYGSLPDDLGVRLMRLSIPEPNTGCWLWLGTLSKAGYGRIMIRRQQKRAHRVAYEYFKGPIPPGLDLDHLCFTKVCINPDHLEPVTRSVNMKRALHVIANRQRTHCRHGHVLNTVDCYGRRFCLMCRRAYDRRRKPRRK